MKFLGPLLLFLLAAARPAFADTVDSSCANHQGISNLNPFGGRALENLPKCIKLYCAPKVKVENTRDNIKFIDETLHTLHTRTVSFSEAVLDYQKACKALMKKFCQACPLMDAVNTTVLRVQSRGAEVDESIATLRLQKNFTDFAGVVSRDEGDLACGSQIPAAATKADELYQQVTSRFANTKCDQ